MEEMTIKTFRCSDKYLDIIADIMKKRKFRFTSEAIRFGLDLARLKLKNVGSTHDIEFVSADQKLGNQLEFKLAGKLTNDELKDYKENYERENISIADFCKMKNILQEYFQ